MVTQVRHSYQFGLFRLLPEERQLLRDNEPVRLTSKCFDLLIALIEKSGHLIEKDELMKRVWPDSFVEEANLSVHMSALRRALGEAANEHRYVETVPGAGYRFVAEVRERWDDGAELYSHALTDEHNANPLRIHSLAVLPLENLSGDPSQEYFADGMTDALIGELAKIGALRVISRTSAMHYKGSKRKLPEIAGELNVDAVVEGSTMRSGERVEVRVQLIQAMNDQHLWSETFDYDLRDVLALQREAARTIAREIQIKLTPQEHTHFESVRQVNAEAYDHYLRGKFYLHRQNRDDNEAAITALEHAVSADPSFAAAHAELAQAYVWKLFLFAPHERQLEERAFVAAQKALELDPDSAVAHLARGRLLWTPANHFPHDKAIVEYRRALTLDPTLDEARSQLSLVYCHIGAFEMALQESREAIATDPTNVLAQFRTAQALNFQRKYEEALTVLRAIPLETNPAKIGQESAWALYNLGRREEASAMLEQLLRDYPEDSGGLYTSIQAVLAASAGQRRKAEQKIKFALEKGKGFGHFHHTAYHIACAYALMNKSERAIKWLEAAAEHGFLCYPLFEKDPNLDNLRRDARFVSFMTKLKQQWEYYKSIL